MAKDVKALLARVKDKSANATKKSDKATEAVEKAKKAAEKKPAAKSEKKPATKIEKATVAIVQDAAPATKFDYAVIADKDARELAKKAAEKIRGFGRSALSTFVDIGKVLAEVKDKLPHGSFTVWAEAETGYTAQHVRNFMRVAERFGARKDLDQLQLAPTALISLAAIEDETKFEGIIEMAKKQRVTEQQIRVEAAGSRTTAPQAPSNRGKGATSATKAKADVADLGNKRAETVAEKGRRYLETIRTGSLQLVSSVVALENLPEPKNDKDRAESEKVAIELKSELLKVLEHVIPFFSPDEVDAINHAGDRKQVTAEQAGA